MCKHPSLFYSSLCYVGITLMELDGSICLARDHFSIPLQHLVVVASSIRGLVFLCVLSGARNHVLQHQRTSALPTTPRDFSLLMRLLFQITFYSPVMIQMNTTDIEMLTERISAIVNLPHIPKEILFFLLHLNRVLEKKRDLK